MAGQGEDLLTADDTVNSLSTPMEGLNIKDGDKIAGGGSVEGDDGETWIDVKDLKQMSLSEIQNLRTNNPSNKEQRLEHAITKVVVRRLPPNITIESYLEELKEVPNYNYISLLPHNEDFPSSIGRRSSIYINFATEEEAFWFKEKYNNMKFYDDRGNSYIACVDFSFFQDVPPTTNEDKIDESGTLEESEIYKDFLQKFEEDPYCFSMIRPDYIPTPEAMLEEILNKKLEVPESTPLLQYLRERELKKEVAKKDRELRLKEKDAVRKKKREETSRRRQKEKEEAAKRRQREKEEASKRKGSGEQIPDQIEEKDNSRNDKKKERERERQRERHRERRLRREKAAAEKEARKNDNTNPTNKEKATSQSGKESSKPKEAKADPKKSFSGTVTYSKTGNPTRWSENSGPRPRKEDKQQKPDSKKSQDAAGTAGVDSSGSQGKVDLIDKPLEKDKDPSSSTKSAFGKPFPVKESAKDSAAANVADNEASNSQSQKDSERGLNSTSGEKKATVTEGGVLPVKRRVVKKVIKIKKVVKEGNGDPTPAAQQDSGEQKTKKVIRVIRKSSKPDDGSTGSSSKPSSSAPKPETNVDKKGDGESAAQEGKGETERERRNRKNRPEIQIYRPGSLRGGGTNKTSNSAQAEKDRDNNNS